jgi:hypothetical protein
LKERPVDGALCFHILVGKDTAFLQKVDKYPLYPLIPWLEAAQDIEVASIEGVVWREIPQHFQSALTSAGFLLSHGYGWSSNVPGI